MALDSWLHKYEHFYFMLRGSGHIIFHLADSAKESDEAGVLFFLERVLESVGDRWLWADDGGFANECLCYEQRCEPQDASRY